ncbi:MAG TPA: arylsulfatase [Tepidisphaeraceae bacterium]|nr:arylsulfatase [Tepidisphaeraceae bacterium]
MGIALRCIAFVCTVIVGLPLRAAPPNVLIILTDDQGWGDLSFNGNTNLATPNIDGLAKAGASFDRFFVQPVCSPTRAEFLTGRYHPRGGVWNVSTGGERLNLDERTIADVFRGAGYATGCFGKWHNGTQYPFHPRGRGFDEYYGFTSGHWGDYFGPSLDHNGKMVTGNGFIVDDLTDRAIAFIGGNAAKKRPFFCYLPIPTPHTPAQVPDGFFKRFDGAELKLRGPKAENVAKTRAVLAMCENIDHNVGRVLAKLDELKIAGETIVVYFHDNGPNGPRWNGGMRGFKGSTDEGGVRSPLLVRWPGRIAPDTRVAQIAGAIDLLPTLTDLAGIPLTSRGTAPGATRPERRPGSPSDTERPLDGISLKPLLIPATPPAPWPDRVIVNHWNGKVSARSQTHRLDATGKLYDMVADPAQTTDVATKEPAVAAKLNAAVDAYRRDVLGALKRGAEDDRPLPVGHAAFPITQLPARDGVGHGKVRRSAPAPNCSFFTNFAGGKEDRITWDVEVATPGKYHAVVYYTCPPADVGATLELSVGPVAVRTKVTEAHDPPLRGQENDRFKRESESYVKDFKPLTIGTLELSAGRATVTLRGVDVPGKSVMDVRMVTLTVIP